MNLKDKYEFLIEIGKAFDGKNGSIDCRGLHIGGKYLANIEDCDFTGSVLYNCFPKVSQPKVFQIEAADDGTLNPFSNVSLVYDPDTERDFTHYLFDDIDASGTWALNYLNINESEITDSTFTDVKLWACGFDRVRFDGVRLNFSVLGHSFFIKCTLDNVVFSGCSNNADAEWYNDFMYSTFNECVIRNVTFLDFTFGEEFQFLDNDFENVNFVDCRFLGGEFIHSKFKNVEFIDCTFEMDIDFLYFDDCTFEGGDLKGLPSFIMKDLTPKE